MHPALQAMLVTPIGHASYLSQDAYGKPLYADLHTHQARVEFRDRRVVDQTGVERLSRARVFFDGTVILDVKDKVVLTDGTAPPILALYEVFEVDGSRSHWELSF